MKKLVSAILILALSIIMIGSASAVILTDEEVQEIQQQEDGVARASEYFGSRAVWAAAGTDGELEFGFDIMCARKMKKLGAIEIEIMRKSNGNWISVETFEYTDSGMGYLYQSNCASISEALYFDATPGRQYFAYITLKAVDDDGSESVTMTTNTVTAHD